MTREVLKTGAVFSITMVKTATFCDTRSGRVPIIFISYDPRFFPLETNIVPDAGSTLIRSFT